MSYFLKHREKGVTTYFLSGKKPKLTAADRVFFLFFAAMAVYYGYRLFALVPWYDELYTYYYFISRGPIYAAIHWPLPNNHVGYSTLSACLGIFGCAPIALRGVSYLCSLGNLILLYRISKKWFTEKTALIPVFLFAGMYMINRLAVQGRGYALVTFCYLAALWTLYAIAAEKKDNKCNYIMFGAALVISLWAIPSSLYMVMPLCLIGGFLLLLDKDYKRLLRLIVASLVSAVCTAALYGILWLAIGSNLLSKTPDGPFYSAGHIEIILHAPFRALREGIDYMLATPYIQSMTRQAFNRKAWYWLKSLFGFELGSSGGSSGFAADSVRFLLVAGLLAASVCLVKRSKKVFQEWYYVLTAVLLAIALVIQCKLPYERVFSFLGVWVALLLGWVLHKTVTLVQGNMTLRWRVWTANTVLTLMYLWVVVFFWAFTLSDRSPYSVQDDQMADAYEQITIEETDTIAVTDCDQEYYLLYRYGIGEERVTRQIEEADIVLLDKALLGEQYGDRYGSEEWKFYLTKEEVDEKRGWLEKNAVRSYENWHYVLYERK